MVEKKEEIIEEEEEESKYFLFPRKITNRGIRTTLTGHRPLCFAVVEFWDWLVTEIGVFY